MMYKIIGRLIKGRETIGYKVIGEDNIEYLLSKSNLLELVKQGQVFNVKYNKCTGSISGVNGIDLRGLPVIKYLIDEKKVYEKKVDEKKDNNLCIKKYSNHELANSYYKKMCEHLGGNILEFKLLENDRVELVNVSDKNNTGRLVIPSFITDFNENGALKDCKYREIYIENRSDEWYNASNLCVEMRSDRLKVVFKYPNRVINMSWMFQSCIFVKEIDLSNFDTSNVIDMSGMFFNCFSLKSIDLSNFDTNKVRDMSYMFRMCESLEELDINNFNTGNVINMRSMFENCKLLKRLKLSKLKTSKVLNMSWMFHGCESLTYLDLSGFNTRKVTTMYNMFSGCIYLKEVGNAKFNTSNVTDMGSMFSECRSLFIINIIQDTSNVKNMYGMFASCSNLYLLDVHNWDTSKVENMDYMFSCCGRLGVLDVSNWDISKVKSATKIFNSCYNLKLIGKSLEDFPIKK